MNSKCFSLLTVARRSRPRSCAQSAFRDRNVIPALCRRRRWFVNLTSLCDRLSNADVSLRFYEKLTKCAKNSCRTTGAALSVHELVVVIGRKPRMQTLFDYQEDECPWYYFDSSYKTLLGACLILFGVFGVLLNGWLFATFIHSHLLVFKSHILVLNLCSASLGRNLLGFPFSGSSAIAKRWLFGPGCCQLFAFLNQFFGVYQMAALLAIVVERYLQARFYRREKSLYLRWYLTVVGLCWLSAVVFSTPPLFSYGLYSCDATGTACTLLWPSVNAGSRQIGFSVPYVLLCGVTPVVAMFYFMGKAIRLENIYYRSELQKEQKRLTKSIHALTVATLAMWIPAAVLAGYQWFPLLANGYRPHVPPVLALIAPIAAEAATSIPVLCYLTVDERLRAALLGRMRKNYALLHPDRAKKFNLNLLRNYSKSYTSLEKNIRKSSTSLWDSNTAL